MIKSLVLTLTAALGAIAMPYAALADLSSSFATDNASPFCFMQTGTGQLLDLTQLCGSGQPLPTEAIAPSDLSVPPDYFGQGSGSSSYERASRGNITRPGFDGPLVYPATTNVDSVNNPGNLGRDGASPCFIFDAQGRPCASAP